MQKIFLLIAGIYGALAVGIGAFGAHALKAKLEANNRLDVFETGVKYHFYHTFALLLVAILIQQYGESKALNWSGYLFAAGIFIFSGSLYILSISNVSKWGAVTPIGGLMFILGWIALIWQACK